MNYYSQLQQNARASLSGFWLRAMIAFTVGYAVSAIVDLLFQLAMVLVGVDFESETLELYIWVLAMAAAGTVLAAPFRYGFKLFLWRLCGGALPSVSTVIEPFCRLRRLFGTVMLEIIKYVIIDLPALIFIAPLFLDTMELADFMQSSSYQSFIGIALALMGVIYYALMSLRLMAVDYIYISNENMTPIKAVGRAFSVTKGRIRHLIPFYFRFIPWLLLNVTGFAQLFVTPYFEMAKCHLVCDLIKYAPGQSGSAAAGFGKVPDGGQA